MKYKFTKEDLELAIKNSLSIAQVCRELGIRPVGGNYKTLKSKFKIWELDTSHFTGQGWNTGKRFRKFSKSLTLDQILIEDSPYLSTNSLKKRLLKEGVLQNICSVCSIVDWNGLPLVLQIDHINGVNTDNRIENLRILCPNCHAQTSTYRGKGIVKSISERRQSEYDESL